MRLLNSALKRSTKAALFGAAFTTVLLSVSPGQAIADGSLSDYQAVPPLISSLGAGDKPNVLVVLDNSNSMDENPAGQAVGSDNASSKSEVARAAVKSLVSTFNGKIRMGLMAYQQNAMSKYKLHNSFYDISFDPANYDDTFTGARDATTKRFREPKPSSTEFIYYNVALPFYSSTSAGTRFCYSTSADFDNGTETYPGGPWDSYRCYSTKTGSSDTLPPTAGDAGTYGWSSFDKNYTFSPTDSDLAQGILDFGRYMAWKPVGDTWFVNTSPGKGYLHIPIADLDATQAAKLNKKLGTSQFSSNKPTDPDYPLQNAGLTPLAGTLDTAYRYFTGGTLASAEGGPAPAVPTGTCGAQDFVVLVTDGLPSTDSSGAAYASTSDAIADVKAKAANLAASGVKVYVVGFALPATVDATLLDGIAVSGGTSKAYFATDTATLNSALGAIFEDIMARTSAASNAAVVANNNAGEGALYQALYSPEMSRADITTGTTKSVSWTGSLHAVFVDTYGNLREDSNGNKQLDDYATDKIISLTYVDTEGRTKLRRYTSTSATKPVGVTLASENDLEDLKPIWDARDALAALENSSITAQRAYSTAVSTTGASRYIFTWIDNDATGTAGVVDSTEVLKFTADDVTDSINSGNYPYLAVGSWSAAQKVVNFVRGYEGIPGFRSRTLDYDNDGTEEVMRLGDIVHSTPVVVGIPNDGYDLLYGDYSYTAFRNHYKDRRQVTYVGANDGMLHAFNGGFWDNVNKKFLTSTTAGSEVAHPLGAELWAYVPQALLPQLKWLTDPDYPHVYYVDGPPLVFDANIFTADTDHPNGWGTVLVVGLRFGGGPFTVDSDGDGSVTPGTDKTLRSSYVVMDVTNPEVPPKLIAEISNADLGFTTSKPAVVKSRAASASGSWTSPSRNEWYLVFGSGPDDLATATSSRTPKVFAYRLNAGSRGLVSGYAPLDLGGSNAFVGDIAAMDWNTDFFDDGVYFGTVSGTTSAPGGSLKRIRLDTTSTTSLWATTSTNNLLAPSQPFISAPTFASDPTGRNWVYAGTGRLLVSGDNTSETQQSFYGVKEPVDATGVMTWGAVSDLRDSTDIVVYLDKTISAPTTLINKAGDTIDTFSKLMGDIETRDGWKIQFDALGSGVPSTRNVSSAARLGETVLFTSYTPNTSTCSPEGDSDLWAVNYRTGTASPYAALGVDTTIVNSDGVYAATTSIDLGLGLASTPIIHRGAGASASPSTATIFTQNSTGEVRATGLTLKGSSGGRQSWRELYLQ